MMTNDLYKMLEVKKPMRLIYSLLILPFVVASFGCGGNEKPQTAATPPVAKSRVEVKVSADAVVITTLEASFRLSPGGAMSASLANGKSLDFGGTGEPSQNGVAVRLDGKDISGGDLDLAHAEVKDATGKLGATGKAIVAHGKSKVTDLDETMTVEVYDDFPTLALLSVQFRNGGAKEVALNQITLQKHSFDASVANAQAPPRDMWTFQGSSLKWGKDEIFAMPAKFSQENPFGAPVAVKDDLGSVGGGIPVVAFWTREVGEAIGHLETLPLALSIPVETEKNGRVEAAVRIPVHASLKPGETYSTPRTFLAIYSGDFYKPLSLWSAAVDKEGLGKPTNNNEDYAVSWCGWGYEFGVTPKQMLDTIPKLKSLGIHWGTLDDGWFTNYGDWKPREAVFPGNEMQDMVKKFHDQGIKLQLWWLPLAVEDGHFGYGGRKYVVSDVVKEHPDWLILDEKGKPARMARNLATLCPALPEVQAYYKQVTERFIRDWDFDGHKLDNIYTTPLCYNPKHHHKSPYDSVNAMGEVYKTIFETTRALKPESVTQSCPCGTPPSVAWLRYMDQAVTADPVGSIQVRRRVKMYKALLGPHAAVYGDHVELTRIRNASGGDEEDLGDDFASTLGTGGVLGTKFTWPDYGPKFKNVYLTAGKEAHWKEWIGLYNQKMLSKGNFLDLYVYGYDIPEAYAIEKDGRLYYAFYAQGDAGAEKKSSSAGKEWSGEIELRGLEGKTYRVTDYVHGRDLGTVTGPTAKMKVEFSDSLLLEVSPAQ
jgi:alpha-galactosidase